MTRVLPISRSHPLSLCLVALTGAALVLLCVGQSAAVTVSSDKTEKVGDRVRVDVETPERVVIDPDPPWGGWDDWHDGWSVGGPKVDVWVDRGDWSVYRPGDRLSVFFRVDRPCYVTIVDYAPDGGTHILFPNRWSGSNFVHPGRAYRIPESRRYSLRIAGPGGEETLFACAHSTPWPSVSGGYWIPPYPPHRGRVVVGRPGGHYAPGRPGRVVVGPHGRWPVPPAWYDRRDRWGCDSVTFHVESGHPWSRRGSGWRDEYVEPRHYHGYDDGCWHDDGVVFRDAFTMSDCSDSYYETVGGSGRVLAMNIECIESRRGDPTEIVGRIVWQDGWGREEVLRLDVEGKHGDRPVEGRIYSIRTGDVRVEMEILGVELDEPKPWQLPGIEGIDFEIRVLHD